MLNKLPILGIAFTTILTLGYSTVAHAGMNILVVQNGDNKNIVVTGLTAGTEYNYSYTKKNKSDTKRKTASKCGMLIIEEANKYSSFSIGGQTITNFSNVAAMPSCSRPLATNDIP